VSEHLEAELRVILGEAAVTSDLQARQKASIDGSALSPIIAAKLPLGLADLVAFPRTAEEIALTVHAATRHRVGITVRGKGTGNYGQGIPMHGGLVIDVSRARAIVDIGDGYIEAEAGASLSALERAATKAGQQLLMYPSTAHSSVGGFLSGGSGGTGSIKNGSNQNDFVLALDVVHATDDAQLRRVDGRDVDAYLHSYGTVGIIARARIRLEPLQDWRGVYASFDDFAQLMAVSDALTALEPTPRLISGDAPIVAAALPPDPAIDEHRAGLRGIFDISTIAAVEAIVVAGGGRIDDVREGASATMKISTLSYNHPIEWLQKAHPGRYFHLEVGGRALLDGLDAVLAVYDGAVLHLEAQAAGPGGMLAGHYESEEQVRAGMERLADLGVGVHYPHHWEVDHEVERTRQLARVTDPFGLLNPGKLPQAAVATAGIHQS